MRVARTGGGSAAIFGSRKMARRIGGGVAAIFHEFPEIDNQSYGIRGALFLDPN